MNPVHELLDRCGSTNDLAREAGEKGAPHGSWISARIQDAGRGRLGRQWESREGNLFISWIVRLESKSLWTFVPLAVAVAVARAAKMWRIGLQIKWPNDLWSAQGEKVGGILCEAVGNHAGSFIVAGLGLNCAFAPEGLDQKTSSLTALSGAPVTADDVRLAIHAELMHVLDELKSRGPSAVTEDYERCAAFPRGTAVQWVSSGKEHAGVVEGLGSSGELLVTLNGASHRLYAEDVKIRAAQRASGGSAL